MFRTFTHTCFSPGEIDSFLNSIIASGYQPRIYREWHGTAWSNGALRYRVDVCVTSFEIAKPLPPGETTDKIVGPDGCKFHQS